jgi:8-amino-7-oxononanoate synthase
MADGWSELIQNAIASTQARGLLRRRRVVTPVSATEVDVDGRRLVNFSSNDYLGLSHAPAVVSALRRGSVAGSGAAALISGYGPSHAAAELAIAAWKGTEGCVLLPSGYQANLAAVQALAGVAERSGRRVRFLLDKLVHASLVDAVRVTRGEMRVFPHNGMPKLRRLLETAAGDELQVVVTESVFSMDGDAADLPAIAALKQEFDFALLLDEAHASGVYGPNGAGLAAALGLSDAVDLSVATLSKALGVSGGAVCGQRAWIEAVVNFGRAYVYTTNPPAALAEAATAAIALIAREPQRVERLHRSVRRVRQTLTENGVDLPTGDSPIVPILFEGESVAVAAAQRLEELGLLVVAVRPPTVPRGTSRLRVTLSAAHSDDEIDRMLRALAKSPVR